MATNKTENPLTELGRALARGRRSTPKPTQVERLRLVDQAIAAINARGDLTESQRARGLSALKKARIRCLDQKGDGSA